MWEIEEKILGVEKMITNQSSPPCNCPIRRTCKQSYMQGACPCVLLNKLRVRYHLC
jgi:hypothetical protein